MLIISIKKEEKSETFSLGILSRQDPFMISRANRNRIV